MESRPRLLADIPSPWNHRSRRFIEPPVYRLCGPVPPHPDATHWRLLLAQDGVRYVIPSREPLLDTAPVWDRLHSRSWIQCELLEIDEHANWCLRRHPLGAKLPGAWQTGLIAKAPDWEDHEEEALDYAASLRTNLDWFDRQETNPGAYYREAGMPAWWWHASESAGPARGARYQDGAFPALASAAIGARLAVAHALPAMATRQRAIAVAIGDWLLRNRTPMTGALPGVPYTAMKEGQFEYSADGRAINLTRAAMSGEGMVLLYRETGDTRYLEYAQHLATVLHGHLRADGSMPYRIRPDTGEVVEEYTCGTALVAQFLDVLQETTPDPRWPRAVERILQWLCAHPLEDFHWKACFEDVAETAPFANLTQMDALWTVRLFCRHAHASPGLLPKARRLFRWVEDQFVNFGDEVSLGIRSYYPCVREQYLCDFPMEAHAANYAGACRDLAQVTGEAVFFRKYVATLNAVVRSQRADGAYSTWGMDRETRFGSLGSGHNWFNCNHMAVAALAACLSHSLNGSEPRS